MKVAIPHVKVRYRKFKEAFEAASRDSHSPASNISTKIGRMHDFEYRHGELYCEEVPLTRIAKEVGTPCYVYSYTTLVRHYRAYDRAFKGVPHVIAFAMKANSNLAILRLMAKEGSGADIVSGGELYRAVKAGVPVEDRVCRSRQEPGRDPSGARGRRVDVQRRVLRRIARD